MFNEMYQRAPAIAAQFIAFCVVLDATNALHGYAGHAGVLLGSALYLAGVVNATAYHDAFGEA